MWNRGWLKLQRSSLSHLLPGRDKKMPEEGIRISIDTIYCLCLISLAVQFANVQSYTYKDYLEICLYLVSVFVSLILLTKSEQILIAPLRFICCWWIILSLSLSLLKKKISVSSSLRLDRVHGKRNGWVVEEEEGACRRAAGAQCSSLVHICANSDL